ncbi:MAG: hypothetical protein EOP09_10775 [Proteobacteria bacterium]|nr:MAG: hypothetical protein EOP09_10775 [Pseudomonadota bacterium]
MIRIELAPLDFYGLGSVVSLKGDALPPEEISGATWVRIALENSLYRSLMFEVDPRLDPKITAELVNVLASRISTVLAQVEGAPIGISPPKVLDADQELKDSLQRTVRNLRDDAVRFEFRSAERSLPIAVYFILNEVGHV